MGVNWHQLFTADVPILETFARGTLMYFFLLVLLRVAPSREVGGYTLPDILVLVLLADAAQNGMAGEYNSLTTGFVLVSTLVFWAQLIDYLNFRYPALRPYFLPRRVELFRNGEFNRRAMRKEFIEEEEIMAEVRRGGLETLEGVKAIYLESDGKLSMIPKE